MGASPVPVSDTGRLAAELEAAGWDGLAVGEAHGILPDPYPALALAAAHTTRLGLGTATAVPLRSPLLAASAMATVHALSAGRASFCVAPGDGAMKVLGREPMPVDGFAAYLGRLQGLLRGDAVDIEGSSVSLAQLAIIDDAYERPKPRLDVAATGERMITVAARTADGLAFAVGADPDRLAGLIARARDERAKAGLTPQPLGCFVQAAVIDADDSTGRDAIRGLVMTHARFSGYRGEAMAVVPRPDHDPIRRSVDAMDTTLRTGYRTLERGMGRNQVDFYPAGVVDDAFVDRFAIVGTAAECARRLRQIVDLGIERIYIGTRGVGADPDERNTVRIGREVLPLVRAGGTAARTPQTGDG
jgi:5,10-methylenetetrahydromethanopterin reductase